MVDSTKQVSKNSFIARTKGIVRTAMIALTIGMIGVSTVGLVGDSTPAHAVEDPRPQPSNKIGDAWSNNQGRFKPGASGNATPEQGGYKMDVPGFNYSAFSAEGCGNFTSFALGRKVGALGSDIHIDKWLSEMIKKGLISSEDYANIPNSAGSFNLDYQGNRGAANLDSIKSAYNEGLVSVVWMHQAGPHFVLIDYVEGDNVYIVDSGSMAYATLNEYLANGYHISDHHVMRASKAAKDLPRLSKGEGSAGTKKEKAKEEERVISAGGIVKEEDLVGMKHYKELKSQYDFMGTKSQKGGDTVPALSIGETKQVAELSNAINDGRMGYQDYLSVGVSFVGLLIMIYALFILVGFMFDRTNNFVIVNLLGKLTFGRMEAVHSSEDVRTEDGVRYVSWAGTFKWAALCIIVSLLLMSGVLFEFIAWFAQIVREKF